ncbi:MAG: FAD-dependent oxidoreductase [Pseudomonadales bacterium]|nr:FAD-dependent oxidoreductase [Pseudomonadales bacterium]
MDSTQRIAIIGSGIAGLTSACLLNRQHDIQLFEANDYIGGHTHTVPVVTNSGKHEIDTGFIVCNDRNYPNFLRFMDKLGVELQPTEMSFSVRNDKLATEYNGHNLNTLFAQRSNLFSPRFIGFVREILRFNKTAKQALADGNVGEMTLNQFLEQAGFGSMLKENYLLPMVAAIWSCSIRQAGDFPLQFFLQFFLNHGLLDIKNRPQWYVLKGGSHAYIKPMTAGFEDRIHLQTPVRSVRRQQAGIAVSTDQGTDFFDQVVFACHSDQALALLENPSPAEEDILGKLLYQDNEVVLHQDRSIMPSRPLAWASWNFLAGDTESDSAPVVSYCMNILQGLKTSEPFLVTLNPGQRLDEDKILQRFNYAHPVYSMAGSAAQARRQEICGVDRIHYCGAYWYNGFHEDGVRSALDVCQRFGESL